MSAVISPVFGNPAAIRQSQIANAAFERARSMGYGKFACMAFARAAKRDALSCETPAEVALRIVRPMQASATRSFRGPGPTGGAA